MQAAIIRYGAILVAFLLLAGYGLWQRGSKEAAYSALDTAQAEARGLRSELGALNQAIEDERKARAGTDKAGDDASTREQGIQDDYDERIEAAVAGRDSELGKLRYQCAASATANLSAGAASAAEAAEEDRLRRASAARVVRAVELAQSERDEAVDRYQAVWGEP